MAARRTPLDKLSERERAQLAKLSDKARSELSELIERARAGTLTRARLEATLCEVERIVTAISPMGFRA